MKNAFSAIRNEHGSAETIKAVIAVAILGIFIYVAVQLVPMYNDHWNLEDDMKTLVQYPPQGGKSEEKSKRIQAEVFKLLDNINADYQKKDVKVNVEKKNISIEIWYSRTHTLPLFPNPKQFHLTVKNVVIKGI